MKRYTHKALHVGRESSKFRYEVRALEASGMPQALLSTTTGEVALTLQRGVKVARTQTARAHNGAAHWHGDAGVASLVVTLYKSQDKSGVGKAYSSKPYRCSLVALGPIAPGGGGGASAGARLKRLSGALGPRPGGAGGLELGVAELDLARLAPPGALLSPAAGTPSASREIEVSRASGGYS